MNLTLSFPEPVRARTLARQTGLQGAIERFQEWMSNPESPVRAIRHQAAKPGEFAEVPEFLAPALRQALTTRGIQQLYSHQAAALEHAQAGRNVVVVTPTASGKTLCYNLPVLNRLIAEPGARAMYLFPTKALAEDQLAGVSGRRGCDRVRRFAPSPTTATRRKTPAGPSASAPTWC